MANEWGETQLSRIAKLRSGFPFKSSSWVDNGVPVIKIANVKDGRIVADGCGYVSHETAATAREWMTQKGDVLIAMTGYVGEIARVRSGEKHLINQRVGRFDFLDDSPVIPEFLFYYLRQSEVRSLLETMARGSAQPNLSASDAAKLWVPVPPPAEQRAIAHILGKLDEKIELNRKQNKTLEAMARALFKAWFVDFEPVRAKIEGRWRRGESLPGLPAHLYDLFPDRLVDSELGEIPEGWEVVSLGDLVDTVKGRSYRSEDLAESDTALVTLKSFARGGGYRPDGLKPFTGSYKLEQVVEPGDIVIACTDVTQAAEVIGRPAIVRGTTRFRKLVASLDTSIIRPCNLDITRAFLYFMARTDAFIAHTFAHTTGTTVLHLAKEALSSFRFARPASQLVESFDALAAPALEHIQALEYESESLAQLRDTLLPKLISGELRIKDAEAFLKAHGL